MIASQNKTVSVVVFAEVVVVVVDKFPDVIALNLT